MDFTILLVYWFLHYTAVTNRKFIYLLFSGLLNTVTTDLRLKYQRTNIYGLFLQIFQVIFLYLVLNLLTHSHHFSAVLLLDRSFSVWASTVCHTT